MWPFAKLPGGGVLGMRFLPVRKARASAPSPVIFSRELHDTIDSAMVSVREADDYGFRVMVISNPLCGSFIYSREEAERRIRKGFPELSDEAVKRGLRHLETRVRVAVMPPPSVQRRESWVNGWMER